LTPAYLNYLEEAVPSVITVHNLAFQGTFPPGTVVELGLPWSSYQPQGLEFYGKMSFMKAGLYYADHITTVSPTYAKEIQTDALGFGLQGLLQQRSEVVTGILNGIDMNEWNPETDKFLVANYSKNDMAGKTANKLELQKRMGLHVDADIPLFGMVSRFTHQKGLDIVLQIAEKLVKAPAQIAFLGNGDAEMQRIVLELAHHNSGSIGAYVGFDEGLSHLIEAGADFFLMPSRFEPCGLNQMYSQRYGTPPIVHATGGLADSVIDVTPSMMATKTASGFVFNEMTPQGLLAATDRALLAFRDKRTWLKIQSNGMSKDFSWNKSAEVYQKIYQSLIK
jgi:starch synthase